MTCEPYAMEDNEPQHDYDCSDNQLLETHIPDMTSNLFKEMSLVLHEGTTEQYEKISLDLTTFSLQPKPLFPAFELGNIPTHMTFKGRANNYSQGKLGSCASFATVACLEMVYYPNRNVKLSESHITDTAERTPPYGDCKPGAPVEHVMGVARDNGVIEAKYWPYNDLIVCNPTPPSIDGKELFKFSSVFPLYQQERVNIVELLDREQKAVNEPIFLDDPEHPYIKSIKLALANLHPVVISVPVIGATWSIGNPTRIFRSDIQKWFKEEATDSPKSKGWHAVVVYGYNDNKKTFQFKNSWGPTWGHFGKKVVVQGHGHLTYDYIIKYSSLGILGIK